MKLKTNFKILLILAIILGAMLLLDTTKVQAFSGDDLNSTSFIFKDIIQGTPTANSLDNIPNTITLDIKKTSPDELTKMIYNQVETELKTQGITLGKDNDNRNYFMAVFIDGFDKLQKPIDKITVSIEKYNDYGSDAIAEKDIVINWTNISTYNETDKKYVENQLSKLPKSTNHISLDGNGIEKPYYMVEQEHELGTKDLNILSTFKSITGLSFINVTGTGGGLDPFNDSNECMVNVYKDGICYTQIYVLYTPPIKVTVPSNIEDTDIAYMNYAKPKIQEYINNYDDTNYHGTVALEKISDYWYKVTSNGKDCGEIIIKKAEGAYIGNNIYVNNLPLDVNITVTPKENNTLETEIKNKGYSKILGSYELTLTGADKLKAPIDITFNVGTEHNGKAIYILHQKKNGTYENFEKTVANGKVTITVSELSPFVLGIKENTNKPTEPITPTEPTTDKGEKDDTPTTNTISKEKDDTPKTGTEIINIIGYVLATTILSGVGIVALKKNLK